MGNEPSKYDFRNRVYIFTDESKRFRLSVILIGEVFHLAAIFIFPLLILPKLVGIDLVKIKWPDFLKFWKSPPP